MRNCALPILIVAAAFGLAAGRAPAEMVVFGEIMYHPQKPSPEYLVLENLTSTPFDIAEWELSAGVHFRFPAFDDKEPQATFLKAHERVVVCATDQTSFRAAYVTPPGLKVFGPWSGHLSNEGERVTLQDKNGRVVCSMKYGSDGDWPESANGTGRSLVLRNAKGTAGDPSNWAASAIPISMIATQRQERLTEDSGGTKGATSSKNALPLLHRMEEREKTGSLSQDVLSSKVVINEIMCDAPGSAGKGEYVELFNKGETEVDLSGWRFDKGIQFHFPAGTRLLGGGFLVVARDAAWLRKVYGALPAVGDFQGRLRNSGERLRLVDAKGKMENEVEFRSGGEWPVVSHSGSSLELINPAMDNRLPSAWQASDESAKGPLRRYASTNIYRELNPLGQPSDYRELHLELAGRGHVALQHLALSKAGTNYLTNALRISTNGAGDNGWLCQGTHWASFVTNGEFHLVSDGRGDDRANRVELDVPSLEPNATYVLQFDARWVSGTPRLIAQSWDRSIAHSFLLERPLALGTPGRANSMFQGSPPPQVDGLRHSPAVPRPGERVKITARVWSVSPLVSVELLHRLDSVDGTGQWQSKSMFDDGEHGGDIVKGDGVYTVELNEYTKNGQTVQLFLKATASNGQTATIPRAGPERAALFVVDERGLPRDLRIVRLILSARDLGAMASGNSAAYGFRFPRPSSHYFNATVIIGEDEIFYGAEARNSGSLLTRTGEMRKPKVRLPEGQSFRGRTKFVYDDDAEGGAAYHNRLTRYLLYLLGEPASENEFVRVVVNAGPVMLREETKPVDHEFLDRNFSGGSHGELYHIAEDWSLLDNWEGVFKDADWAFDGRGDAATWRNSWPKRTRATEDDYSRLIELFGVLAQTNATPREVEKLFDTRAALRLIAVRGYVGDWDTFTMQRGRNGFFYRRPSDGKFQFLHWDGDEGFVLGQPFYGDRVKRWVEQPQNLRVLYYYLLKLVKLCSQSPQRVHGWLQAEAEAAGKSVFQAGYLNFFKKREVEVLRAMEGKDRLAFAGRMDSGSGAAHVLSGQAPYGVMEVIVEGHAEAQVKWTSDVQWRVSGLRLAAGETDLIVKGVDDAGKTVSRFRISAGGLASGNGE